MKQMLLLVPQHIRSLFGRLLILLILMSFSRIVFYISNFDSFQHITSFDFLLGVWYDATTICIYLIPFYLFWLIPFKNRNNKIYHLIFKTIFILLSSLILIFNFIDVEYFQFTNKRSTIDLFTIVGAGNDMNQLFTTFIIDFWWLILIFILFVFSLSKLYNLFNNDIIYHSNKQFFKSNIFSFFICIPIFILGFRGTTGLRPIGVLDVSRYTLSENSAFVLNTAFTMAKSVGKERLEEKHYFPENICNTLVNPIKESQPAKLLPNNSNVFIIILESFGNEFVGKLNHDETYTPFLDSLMDHSLYFEYGFANGKKSIEAVPAVVSSIPTLMDNPYISSSYSSNQLSSLPQVLKKNGYSTAFFHGATNGSMRFNSFASQAGYEHYFGRTEYNNDQHFDKTWGILDEYFNPWTAKKTSQLKAPFCATLFTLSSHHPYYIPPHMRNKLKKGKEPICASINYGDYALRKFFEQAKKEKWFENTLFVICADHTPSTSSTFYSDRTQMYRIPIIYYHPKGYIKAEHSYKISQQIDIFPSILDALNIQTKFYSFGNSIFQNTNKEAITYIEGTYLYFFDHYLLNFSNNQARNLYDFSDRKKISVDCLKKQKNLVQKQEKRLKAIIQRYNSDLIHNKMH